MTDDHHCQPPPLEPEQRLDKQEEWTCPVCETVWIADYDQGMWYQENSDLDDRGESA